MADEYDRKIMPGFFQTAFTISLGATYKGFEMMRTPVKSAESMFTEMRSLAKIPPDAGAGIQEKAKAVAAAWMQKGANWMEQCKAAGEKFTQD